MSATTQPPQTILAEGKTKIIQPTNNPGELLVTFKDDATAFNAKKHAVIEGKGQINATISRILFEKLAEAGITSCYQRPGSQPNQLVYRALTMIPLEVVVRNDALGSLVKRLGFTEGQALKKPLVEFFQKTDCDPQITDALILELGILKTPAQLATIKLLALQINEVLVRFYASYGIRCADFKLEFGIDEAGMIILGDELSPDNFRLRDAKTGQVLDKDVFRLDLADVGETYRSLLKRLESGATETIPTSTQQTYRAEVFVHSRNTIFSPESKAIQDGLKTMGYTGVSGLVAGRRFTFEIQATSLVDAECQVKTLTDSLLANPVIEDYEYSLSVSTPS